MATREPSNLRFWATLLKPAFTAVVIHLLSLWN